MTSPRTFSTGHRYLSGHRYPWGLPPLGPGRKLGAATALALWMMVAARIGWSAEPFRIFVTNEFSGDLSVIDSASRKVITTIPLGKRPRGVRVSPDGHTLYVALSGSPVAGPGVDESKLPPPDKQADGIGVVDLRQLKLTRVLTGVSDPEQMAVSRDGRMLVVASEDTGSAVLFDVASGRVLASVPIGAEPEGVNFSPDGRIAWMTAEGAGTVSLLDMKTRTVLHQIKVGSRPRNTAFSPDGRRAYVTDELDASISVIDTAAARVLATVALAGDNVRPMGIVSSADGRRLFVTTGHAGKLFALDAVTLKVLGTATVGARPWGIAISPDARYVYTANGLSDDVTVVRTDTLEVTDHITVGKRPWGVAISR